MLDDARDRMEELVTFSNFIGIVISRIKIKNTYLSIFLKDSKKLFFGYKRPREESKEVTTIKPLNFPYPI